MTVPFPTVHFLPPGEASPRRSRKFWLLQLVVWPAYGAALMLPWIGTYTIASMVPNKLVVAASGLVFSTGLRALYRDMSRRNITIGAVFASALTASLMAGLAWDALLSAVLGGSAALDLRHLGALSAGAPQLSGGLYHALILFAWSLAYLVMRPPRATPAFAGAEPSPPESTRATAQPNENGSASSRVVLRDGRRAIVLEAGEIDWIAAEGDYVRVHAGSRRILVRSTMGGIESSLPSADFARIHRSAIVRVAQVRELVPRPNNEFHVVLRDGTKLRASRTHTDRLRAVLGIPRT